MFPLFEKSCGACGRGKAVEEEEEEEGEIGGINRGCREICAGSMNGAVFVKKLQTSDKQKLSSFAFKTLSHQAVQLKYFQQGTFSGEKKFPMILGNLRFLYRKLIWNSQKNRNYLK